MQRWLGIVNVFLLLGALTMIFSGLTLKMFYYMDLLDFITVNFVLLPWMLVGVGTATFLVSTFGFVIAPHEKRALLFVFGFSLIVLCFFQIATVFVAMECRWGVNVVILICFALPDVLKSADAARSYVGLSTIAFYLN